MKNSCVLKYTIVYFTDASEIIKPIFKSVFIGEFPLCLQTLNIYEGSDCTDKASDSVHYSVLLSSETQLLNGTEQDTEEV